MKTGPRFPAVVGLLATFVLGGCGDRKTPAVAPLRETFAPLVPESIVQKWLERAGSEEAPVVLPEGARTLAVSPGGSDANDGAIERPLKTIGRALEIAQPGERVLVRAGTYTETIQFPRSGKPGKPIVLEGERGPGGEWLAIIDPGRPLRGWAAAPEVGEGVFKIATQGLDPYCLTVDGKQVLRIHDRLMSLPGAGRKAGENYEVIRLGGFRDFEKAGVGGVSFLTIPADGLVREMKEAEGSLPFWNGIEALYGVSEGTVFLRFRDGRNPDGLQILAAPAASALAITNQSHLVVRHLEIRGAEKGIVISGAKAFGNVIEHNSFRNGLWRVTLTGRTRENSVRHNLITLGFFGSDDFGAWGGTNHAADENPKSQVRMMLYRAFKHLAGTDASADIGVRISGAGPGNRVSGNRIFSGIKGIHAMSTPDLVICGNVLHNLSSIAIVTLPDLKNARIHDNLLFDSNILLRIHQYNTPSDRSESLYRNVFVQPPEEGTHVYVHYNDFGADFGPDQESVLGIYQNTFVGGNRGLVCGSQRRNIVMSRTCVLNNIISTANEPVSYLAPGLFERLYEVFDHNWVGGARSTVSGLPIWFGVGNINAEGRQLWPSGEWNGFEPPAEVQGKGVDLSRPFFIEGKSFDPLPGMEPGYFHGAAPDLGALQHRPSATDGNPPKP